MKSYILVLAIIAVVLASGCVTQMEMTAREMEEKANESQSVIEQMIEEMEAEEVTEPEAPPVETIEAADWKDIELTDVTTGEKFKVSDFAGKPILVESFAVWCPTCLVQQKEVGTVKELRGEEIIHISIDTDPNEDAQRVREHIQRNDLDWYFAVAPIEMTNLLIDDFGFTVVNAPSAPVVLVCGDQSASLLRTGVKSANELIETVNRC
jgi:thiol-disulfide isomerase/thioredoxin